MLIDDMVMIFMFKNMIFMLIWYVVIIKWYRIYQEMDWHGVKNQGKLVSHVILVDFVW